MTDFKLVPVVPTSEMLAAGKYALEFGCYASGIYADMLAAAPVLGPRTVDTVSTDSNSEQEQFSVIDMSTAAPQPTPDVTKLVEALEAVMEFGCDPKSNRGRWALEKAESALATHKHKITNYVEYKQRKEVEE